MPATPPNSLIVITGITGYLGSHVALAALQAGHRVRGTVRALGRADELKVAFEKLGVDLNKLDFVVVDDLTSQQQMREAIRGADGIAHVALPGNVPGDSDERPQEAIDSNLALLNAAAQEPSIKRVVLTSSSVAVISPPEFKGRALTEQDWNDSAVQRYENELTKDEKSPDWVALRYSAGKTLSEKAAWKWASEQKVAFDIVSLLPNINFGPVLFGGPRSTIGLIYALLQNNAMVTTTVPPQWFVDVRDSARIHVLAFTTPSLSGKRVWVAAEPFGWNKVLAILRKDFPDVQVPPDVVGWQGEVDPQEIDNSVATEALGGWISLEKSIVDTAKGFGF